MSGDRRKQPDKQSQQALLFNISHQAAEYIIVQRYRQNNYNNHQSFVFETTIFKIAFHQFSAAPLTRMFSINSPVPSQSYNNEST